MEKLTAFIMCISLALLISACGKNSETSLKPGIYTLQNAEKNVPGYNIGTVVEILGFTVHNDVEFVPDE